MYTAIFLAILIIFIILIFIIYLILLLLLFIIYIILSVYLSINFLINQKIKTNMIYRKTISSKRDQGHREREIGKRNRQRRGHM
jgi:predicted membrane protein